MRTYERYPGHANDFIKASLPPKIFPSLKEIWTKADTSKSTNYEKREYRRGGRLNMYFCVGFYEIWRENIHRII